MATIVNLVANPEAGKHKVLAPNSPEAGKHKILAPNSFENINLFGNQDSKQLKKIMATKVTKVTQAATGTKAIKETNGTKLTKETYKGETQRRKISL